MSIVETYSAGDKGIWIPPVPAVHDESEYPEEGFDTLLRMQDRHFWYRGRHRFIAHSVQKHIRSFANGGPLRAIDLGTGCGGWVKYLSERLFFHPTELAVADSSILALEQAGRVLPTEIKRYQVDLLNLQWEKRWEAVFLLDVLEHIQDDRGVLEQICNALVPGGIAFITTPALRFFWSWNDDVAHHKRRYSRADFSRLAAATGFEVLDSRYFMFFLSPLLALSRLTTKPKLDSISPEDLRALLDRMHQVPASPINGALSAIFNAETPLGHHLPFPWGTSILAVLKKI